MLSKIGFWLARGGATTFTIWGIIYFIESLGGRGFSDGMTEAIAALVCFLIAAVFYGIHEITTAINSLKEDTNKLEE
jgi:hypothetical protein